MALFEFCPTLVIPAYPAVYLSPQDCSRDSSVKRAASFGPMITALSTEQLTSSDRSRPGGLQSPAAVVGIAKRPQTAMRFNRAGLTKSNRIAMTAPRDWRPPRVAPQRHVTIQTLWFGLIVVIPQHSNTPTLQYSTFAFCPSFELNVQPNLRADAFPGHTHN
jgi:hypothetical protein